MTPKASPSLVKILYHRRIVKSRKKIGAVKPPAGRSPAREKTPARIKVGTVNRRQIGKPIEYYYTQKRQQGQYMEAKDGK